MAHALRAVLVVGILLAAGLVYAKLAVLSEAAPPGAVQHEPELPRPVTVVESAPPPQRGDAATPVLEREVAPPPAVVTGRTNTAARLLGRCVAAEDGAPLQGCVIEIVARGEERGTTDADGCFAIDFVPMPSGSITVKAAATGRVSLQGQLLVDGSVGDVGTIMMPRGFVVSGRVIDPDGIAVPGHTVIVSDVDTALRSGQTSKSAVQAVCAEDGSFTLGAPLRAGNWHAQLRGPRRQRGDGAFRVDAITGVEPLALVVELPHDIRGVVVDEAGLNLSNVGLRTEHGDAVSNWLSGEFELVARQPVRGSTRILLQDPAQWSPDFEPPTVAWGQHDVRIVMPRGSTVTIEVVDDTGAPVAEFGVLFGPEAATSSRDSSQPSLPWNGTPANPWGPHPGGRVDLASVRRGRHVLRVLPKAPDLRASGPRILEVGTTALAVQRVVLERLIETRVLVVVEDQEGLGGADVELFFDRAHHDAG